MATALKFADLFSFAWSFTNSRVVDYYRHYFSEMVTVNTKSGPVKGFKIASAFDYHYINFIGIPYAKPPIGELRFKVCSFNNMHQHTILIFYMQNINRKKNN